MTYHAPRRPVAGAAIIPDDAGFSPEVLAPFLNTMILSASGWRTVFAKSGNENDAGAVPSVEHTILAGLAALVYARYLALSPGPVKRTIAVGQDTRPTGPSLAQSVIRVFLACGLDPWYLHVAATPQILAWTRASDTIDGFFYISASHNPIGHNGFKMGFADGSVVGGEMSRNLVQAFRDSASNQNDIDTVLAALRDTGSTAESAVYDRVDRLQRDSRAVYRGATSDVAKGPGAGAEAAMGAVENRLKLAHPGIVVDFNGSARTVSIDRELLSDLGCRVHGINAEPGEIRHQIVPEGPGLVPCKEELARLSAGDPGYLLGYVPDNDGDRGNLVVTESPGEARQLEAQEVFALCAVSELSWLEHTGATPAGGTTEPDAGERPRVAVVVNGPTSMRIDRIAERFGADVFRAEVGEANVVGLARELREQGYLVRFLGEGSNGGNITHPSTVRDPLQTVFAILKLLFAPDGERRSPLDLWMGHGGTGRAAEEPGSGSVLSAAVASLPRFSTTSAFSPEAIMKVSSTDHGALKSRIEDLWETSWKGLTLVREELGVDSYWIENYEGTQCRRGRGNRTGEGRGGFKILLADPSGVARAFLWVRGSGTEPVFRVMVDVEGDRPEVEHVLLTLLRELVASADESV